MKPTKQVNIRMQEETWRRLRIISVTERKTMGGLIEEMLQERLSQYEELHKKKK